MGPQVDKKLSEWEGGRAALRILIEQRGGRKGTALLFNFAKRLSQQTYDDIIKKAAQDLAWDEDLGYHSHGLRHGGLGFFMEETGARFSDEELREMLDMSRCMVNYYAIPNAKRKREPIGDEDLQHSLLMSLGPLNVRMQVNPLTVRMEQVYTGIPMGPRTLPEALGGPMVDDEGFPLPEGAMRIAARQAATIKETAAALQPPPRLRSVCTDAILAGGSTVFYYSSEMISLSFCISTSTCRRIKLE